MNNHEQTSRNKHEKIYYEPENRDVTIYELAKLTGIKRTTLYSRYQNGLRGKKLYSPVDTKLTKVNRKRKSFLSQIRKINKY